MRMKRMVMIIFVLAALLVPSSAGAKPIQPGRSSVEGVTCNLPESDAEALVILNNYYPNRYTWDHTDLTIAIQAHPSTTEEQMDAIEDAIDTWSQVLEKCFDGLITLTNVTGTGNNSQQSADIVVHYVPTAGGSVFAGYAICGAQGCPNILVRTDLPPSWGVDPYSPEYFYWVTLHEIGHALGLGHATNLRESTDLMGYGWIGVGDATLSQCDIDALAYVFAWAIEGVDPYAPGPGPYECSPEE